MANPTKPLGDWFADVFNIYEGMCAKGQIPPATVFTDMKEWFDDEVTLNHVEFYTMAWLDDVTFQTMFETSDNVGHTYILNLDLPYLQGQPVPSTWTSSHPVMAPTLPTGTATKPTQSTADDDAYDRAMKGI